MSIVPKLALHEKSPYDLTTVFRSWFSKNKPPLEGAPATRRIKIYSAQSGYVYEYYYEGHRPFRSGGESGSEYAFTVSADRKNWHPAAVMVSGGAIRGWEETHARELSATERYAIAKMALFQAFDERPAPDRMKEEVRVRAADVDAIIETLGL